MLGKNKIVKICCNGTVYSKSIVRNKKNTFEHASSQTLAAWHNLSNRISLQQIFNKRSHLRLLAVIQVYKCLIYYIPKILSNTAL